MPNYSLTSLSPLTSSTTLELSQPIPSSAMNVSLFKKQTLLTHYKFPEKAQKFKNLLMGLNEECFPHVITASKKPEPKRGGLSKTRSNYIGVTKNASHWQALISVQKRKTYIGTYSNEREAAVAFDFICILLHKLTAKTNFNYTKGDILSMLDNYERNNHMLVVSELNLSNSI